MTQNYTYLKLRDTLFNIKEEQKSIPVLEFENVWRFRLETLAQYKRLFDEDIIVSGSYYPRLKTSRQQGLRAWKEVKRTHFKNTEKVEYDIKFLDSLLKRKRIPEVYFNTICFFDWDSEVDYDLNPDGWEFKYLETTNVEPPPPVNDINKIQTDEKFKVVLDYIKEMCFTKAETMSLVIFMLSALC